MKYGIHRIVEGQLGERLKGVPDNPAGEGEWYMSETLAHDAIHGGIDRSDLPGKSTDYHVQTYSDDGGMLEKVMPSDQEQAVADARTLMDTDKTVVAAMAALVAVRQMHAMAARELEQHLANLVKVGNDPRPPHPLAAEVFLQSAAAQANQAFNELDLFEGLTQTVFPWLQTLITDHVRQDKIQKEKEFNALEKKRRSVPVPVGLVWYPEHVLPVELDRVRSMVLVGYGPAVRYLLTLACEAALSAVSEDLPGNKFVVGRFADAAEVTEPDVNPNFARLGRGAWQTGQGSRKAFHKKLIEIISSQLMPALKFASGLPDLLLIDDVAALITGVVIGSNTADLNPARAATAMHWITDWSKYVGLAVMGAMPKSRNQAVDLRTPEWSRLRENCDLYEVMIASENDDPAFPLATGNYRLYLANAEKVVVAFADVDAKLIDSFSQIVLS